MFDCLILGDSIAKGVGEQLPECVIEAEDHRIKTVKYMKKYKDGNRVAETVIISLGSGDHINLKTEEALTLLREEVVADNVIWILPSKLYKTKQHNIVLKLAKSRCDRVIEIPSELLGNDHLHPTDYKQLANLIKE